MTGIKVPIEGDISPILAEFAKLPGRTDAEMQAVGAVIERQIRTGSVAKAFAELPGVSATQAKKAANAVSREMERAAAETKKNFDEIKKGATAAFGGIVGDIEDVFGAFEALGPTAGAAAASMVGIGLAASAIAGVTTAVIDLERSAASAIEHLDKLKIPINEDDRANIEAANSALDALVVQGERVVVMLASDLAPATQELAQTYSGLISDIIKVTENLGYEGLAWTALQAAGGAYIDVMYNYVGPGRLINAVFGEQAEQVDTVAQSFNVAAINMQKYADVQEAARRAADEDLGVTIGAAEAEAVAKEHEQKQQARARAQHERAQRKTKDDTEAARRAEEQAKADAKFEYDRASAWVQHVNDINAQANAEAKAAEQQVANEQAARVARQAAADEQARIDEEAATRAAELASAQREAVTGYATSAINAAAQIAQAVANGAEEGSKAQRDAALVAFRIQQAAGIGQVAMDTAGAVTKAMALFGPPPSPAGIAAIAAASAIGLAQAALVAAQPPPSFHTGGMISTAPLAPDETMVRARKGEEIRTRQQQSGGAPIQVQMVYQHRVFDTFVRDNMRQSSSPLRNAINHSSGRLLGHRNSR